MDVNIQFETQGYTILRKFFEQEEIDPIEQIVNRIYRQWQTENHHALREQQLINMHSLTHPQYFQSCRHERIRFFNLIAPTKLTHALAQIVGTDIYFHNTQLFFNPHNPKKRPYWHRDLQYSPIDDAVQAAEQRQMLSLHVRIPLVSEQGVELIPATHQRWDTELEKNVRFELNGQRNSDPLPGSVLIGLEPGDVLIFNAQSIHRGNYALNSTRKALDLCVGKPHPLVEEFLDPTGLPTDDEIHHIQNRHWYDLARQIVAKRHKSMTHFPQQLRALPKFDGPFDAYKLTAQNCDVLFASYPKGTEISPHTHDTDNVGVITQGELILIMNGKESRYQSGDWYHVPAQVVHAARFEQETSEIEFWFQKDPLDD